MRKFLVVSSVLLAFLSFSSTASALVMSFDEYSVGASTSMQLPANYGGFDWSTDFGLISDSRYTSVFGNSYGATSASNAAFNYGGILQAVVTNSSLFDFNGASFASFSQNDAAFSASATAITVEGYSNGSLIGSVSASLSNGGYNWLQADLFGVDELRFISSSSRSWWLMDDFTFNNQAIATSSGTSANGTAPVPEPSTLILVGVGILGLGVMGRKKLKN